MSLLNILLSYPKEIFDFQSFWLSAVFTWAQGGIKIGQKVFESETSFQVEGILKCKMLGLKVWGEQWNNGLVWTRLYYQLVLHCSLLDLTCCFIQIWSGILFCCRNIQTLRNIMSSEVNTNMEMNSLVCLQEAQSAAAERSWSLPFQWLLRLRPHRRHKLWRSAGQFVFYKLNASQIPFDYIKKDPAPNLCTVRNYDVKGEKGWKGGW